MQRMSPYRRFELNWEEPPLISDRWVINISSKDPRLHAKVGRNEVVDGATFEAALEKAKRLIDSL